ncbi:MAG: hypothetical protein R3A47_05080 [Polyangiales bacterium]
MSANRNKLLEAARKFTDIASFSKAIDQYEKLVELDKNDVRSLLKIGDLQTREGKRKEAAQPIWRAADHYHAERGFFEGRRGVQTNS